jgi:hypothetical protein
MHDMGKVDAGATSCACRRDTIVTLVQGFSPNTTTLLVVPT